MCPTANWRWHLGAFCLYASCAWLTLDPGGDLQHHIIGGGGDAYIFIWFLEWWPWALTHHMNPVYCHLVWQPGGLNLLWTTSIPVLAILAAPLTYLLGAVGSYNMLAFLAPVLAAYAAYWLCLYCAGLPLAAIIGGFLFGFSSYEMARASTQLDLSFTALVPLAVLIVLMRIDDHLSRKIFIFLMSLLLILQFGVSTEVFATGCFFALFGGIFAGIAFPERHLVLLRSAFEILIVGLVSAAALSPALWAMFFLPHDFTIPGHWPKIFVTDFTNFLVPTAVTALGGNTMTPLTRTFTGFLSEQSGYLGAPLCLIIWLYARGGRYFMLFCLVFIASLSLGPSLYFAGIATHTPLPWMLFQRLPLLGDALPCRFMLFASLISAVVAARWISTVSAPNRRSAYMLGGLAMLSLWPNRHQWEIAPELRFFEPGRLAAVLETRAPILILPFGASGASIFWQAEDHFGFSQPAGYLGYPPQRLQADIPMMQLFFGLPVPDPVSTLVSFCRSTGTDNIVAGPDTPAKLLADLEASGWKEQTVDEVKIFTVPQNAD